MVLTVLHSSQGISIQAFEEFDEWPRNGVPGTSKPNPQSTDVCKKDILIVLDVSYSIGKTAFDGEIKPFMKNLIKNKKLNVGVHGTHIAMIVFSSQPKTKVLLTFGDKTSQKELELFVDQMDWVHLSGGRTKTGLALEIADTQIFKANSPGNYRPKVANVVILITDGEPRGAWNEEILAYQYADSLKKKKVLIIGIAAGPQSKSFRDVIEKIATSKEDTFDVDFSEFDKIMTKLVDASCQPFKPGDCDCPSSTLQDLFVKPGQTATFTWVEPRPSCKDNRTLDPSLVTTVVSPAVKSPAKFGVGPHTLTYTYTFIKEGFDLKCYVTFNVKACECPKFNPTVVVYVDSKDSNSKASVSWSAPQPSCKATQKSVSPNVASGDLFSVGSHTVDYVYSTVAGFDITCSVNIEVRLCYCPPFKTKELVYIKPRPSSSTRNVAWMVPKPACFGARVFSLTTTPPNFPQPPHSFPVGQRSVTYHYAMGYHKSNTSSVDLNCRVDIEVKVIPCQGRDYDPQSEICCCGKVQTKKLGWQCCGKKYHDASQEKCCGSPFYNIAAKSAVCPGADMKV